MVVAMKRLPLLGTGLLLALLPALVACGTGRPHPAASPTGMSDAQVLAIGRQYAQCVRTHGIPNFPDPVVTGGHLEMPAGGADTSKRALSANQAAQTACRPILNQLPASAQRSPRPVTAQDMQNLLKFAQCVRAHGVPRWPDPDANGEFPLETAGLGAEGKSPRVQQAMQACRQYWSKGIDITGTGGK
jgi:hypothetical protein